MSAVLIGRQTNIQDSIGKIVKPYLSENLGIWSQEGPLKWETLCLEIEREFYFQFQELYKDETHNRGRLALERDVAWATLQALNDLPPYILELARFQAKDLEIIKSKLDSLANGLTQLPSGALFPYSISQIKAWLTEGAERSLQIVKARRNWPEDSLTIERPAVSSVLAALETGRWIHIHGQGGTGKTVAMVQSSVKAPERLWIFLDARDSRNLSDAWQQVAGDLPGVHLVRALALFSSNIRPITVVIDNWQAASKVFGDDFEFFRINLSGQKVSFITVGRQPLGPGRADLEIPLEDWEPQATSTLYDLYRGRYPSLPSLSFLSPKVTSLLERPRNLALICSYYGSRGDTIPNDARCVDPLNVFDDLQGGQLEWMRITAWRLCDWWLQNVKASSVERGRLMEGLARGRISLSVMLMNSSRHFSTQACSGKTMT